MTVRRIGVITGTRAEYGILKPVIELIESRKDLSLSLLVAGMHLDPNFGSTIDEIKSDGFQIAARVPMPISDDSRTSMAIALGEGIKSMAKTLLKVKPDIVLLCGDRGEAFAGAIAAAHIGIPVAHLFGGDSASGSNIDDAIRHSITRFAHLHLTARQSHSRRLARMGEEKWRIHWVGSPALDVAFHLDLNHSAAILKALGLKKNEPFVLVVQHPTTINDDKAGNEMRQTLKAVTGFDLQTLVIYPNSDAGSREIIKVIENYKATHGILAIKNVSHKDFLTLMASCKLMVGNSSSGIHEAPTFKTPFVNVGIRQMGRERASNVVDAKNNVADIKRKIRFVLEDAGFQSKLKKCVNPYGDGMSSKRIVDILAKVKIDEKLLRKKIMY